MRRRLLAFLAAACLLQTAPAYRQANTDSPAGDTPTPPPDPPPARKVKLDPIKDAKSEPEPVYPTRRADVKEAFLDVKKLPYDEQQYQRYLSLGAAPQKDLPTWYWLVDWWLNTLAGPTDAEYVRAVRVTDRLLRFDTRDTGVAFQKAFDRQYLVESYFYEGDVEDRGFAGHLEANYATLLALRTRSKTPIVMVDFWLVESSQQEDRDNNTGYFDYLGVKNRTDFDALVGLDQKLAERLRRRVLSILEESGVAINNRQVEGLDTINGLYWRSKDVINNRGRRNAVRNLDKDFQHDAEEIFASDSRDFLKIHLNDANGVQQKSVPPNIAHDKTRAGNDATIHPWNCYTCHTEGIRPINDYARAVYVPFAGTSIKTRGGIVLASFSPQRTRELTRLYLSDLDTKVTDAQFRYARAVLKVTGKKTADVASAFGKQRDKYTLDTLDLVDIARYTGYSKSQVHGAVKLMLSALRPGKVRVGSTPETIFAGLLAPKTRRIRREHFEEGYPVMMQYLMGLVPITRVE